MTPEFSRRERLARLGRGAALLVEATPSECAALARRFDLPAIASLRCDWVLGRPTGGGKIAADGRLTAEVTQITADTLDEVARTVTENFAVVFVPAGTEAADIDLEGPDEIPYEGDAVDLGEAAAEQLALALEPFPRAG